MHFDQKLQQNIIKIVDDSRRKKMGKVGHKPVREANK